MKSNCCDAPMTVGGEGTGEGDTHFWVCESCLGTYQPLGEGSCPVQRVTFDPPIQVRSDQELIIEGNKATVRPVTSTINKGIAKTVELLQNCGFNTTDSGDGATHSFACDLPIPYVHMTVQKRFCLLETDRLYTVLQNNGIDDLEDKIQMTYDPHTETCILSIFNITL